jgi:hypothetical protein
MKRIKAYILTSIIVILFSSCEEKNNNSNYERIYFPENFELLNSNISNKNYIQKSKKFKFKIFTQINVSCATCLQKLTKWQNFIKQLDGCDSIYLIPVCKSKDKFELIKYLFESNKVRDSYEQLRKGKYNLLYENNGFIVYKIQNMAQSVAYGYYLTLLSNKLSFEYNNLSYYRVYHSDNEIIIMIL